MDILIILSLALAIDLVLGEPPRATHPVVWMGKVIAFLERGGTNHRPLVQFIYGVGITLVATGLFVAPAYFLLFYLKSLNFVAYVIIGGVLLKSAFSLKGLRQAALKVKGLLTNEELNEARFALRSLVSRDAKNLPQPLLVSAAVESVAESTCDSFVAPLFYFLLLGVPGAIAYRIINTADTMIGYHGQWEYLGKFAARLDDVINFLPARLTALMIVIAAWLCQKDVSGSTAKPLQPSPEAKRQLSPVTGVMLRDHNKTQSPNAGWPMSAAAGGLGVQLEKTGHYKLGDNHYPLSPETIGASLQVMAVVALLWSLTCISVGVIRFVVTA
ncbi:Cobalamin biosynthesis protein CobD [subsurface metagenome]